MESPTELTPLQAGFAAALVECNGNASAAARAAGYSPTSARVVAHRLMRNPAVQAEIRARQWQRLNGPLAAASLNVLRQALDMSNEAVPWSARIEAAKTVLDRAGIVAVEHPDKQPKQVAEQDLTGLLARLVEARALVRRRAGAVDALPVEG